MSIIVDREIIKAIGAEMPSESSIVAVYRAQALAIRFEIKIDEARKSASSSCSTSENKSRQANRRDARLVMKYVLLQTAGVRII